MQWRLYAKRRKSFGGIWSYERQLDKDHKVRVCVIHLKKIVASHLLMILLILVAYIGKAQSIS